MIHLDTKEYAAMGYLMLDWTGKAFESCPLAAVLATIKTAELNLLIPVNQ